VSFSCLLGIFILMGWEKAGEKRRILLPFLSFSGRGEIDGNGDGDGRGDMAWRLLLESESLLENRGGGDRAGQGCSRWRTKV
jgi:hypothetical protein